MPELVHRDAGAQATPMASLNPSPSKTRLAGVELTRGAAAYGVIVIHVGLINSNHLSPAVQSFQNFLGLTCVAFFLAASFYFSASSPSESQPFALWLKSRVGRLLVPYALWSIIYTALQVFQALLHPDWKSGLSQIFSDPLGRIFLGESGVALYFLPLLFVGLLIMKALSPIFAHGSPLVLGVACLIALVIAATFDLGEIPFFYDSPSALHLPLGILGFALRCLPYIFLGWIMARWGKLPPPSVLHRIFLALPALLLVAVSSQTTLPVPQSLIGYAVLLLALAVPLPDNQPWINLIGRYSFAIYLMHQVFLEAIKLAAHGRLNDMGLSRVLPITLAVFGLSFLVAYVTDRFGGKAARILMALPDRNPRS